MSEDMPTGLAMTRGSVANRYGALRDRIDELETERAALMQDNAKLRRIVEMQNQYARKGNRD